MSTPFQAEVFSLAAENARLKAQRDALLAVTKDLKARLETIDDLDVILGERVGAYEAIRRAQQAISACEKA